MFLSFALLSFSFEYTKEKLNNAKDKNMKHYLENELKHYENLLVLTEAAEKYREKFGKTPDRELAELVKSRIINVIPEDIYGGEYIFDEVDGKVKTSTEGDRGYKQIQEEKRKKELEKLKSKEEPEILSVPQ